MPNENAALVHRWFEEVWNKHRADAIDELLAPDTVAHGLGPGGTDLKGPGPFREFHAQFTGAFPDIQIKVEDVVCEGDLAACRFTGTGTHQGHHLGAPPSGRKVAFTGMSFTRWKDGQITEGWNNVDIAGILMQLDLLAPAQPREH